jgi:SAM-dependent methyltransferase
VRPRRHYTVNDALDDWLEAGLDGLAPATATVYRNTIAKALRGRGRRRARQGLARRRAVQALGLQVTGIDPVARHLRPRGQARPGDAVSCLAGTAEDLPAASGSTDLIWCRDVLCLSRDLGRGYREFRRVLGPGGRALVYQMFATGLLEPAEAGRSPAGHGLRSRGHAPGKHRGRHQRRRPAH